MHSKEMIEDIIRDAVKNVTGITALERDTNLIDQELKIIPVDFLYIFDILEKKLQVPAHNIFIDHTFEVMSVAKLADALFELGTDTI